MNRVILFFAVYTAISGYSPLPADSVKMPPGYYTGSDKLFTIVFLKVTGDTAIADFIMVQKFPRDLHADTLVYDGSNNTWKGKNTRLYQERNSYFINSSQPMFQGRIRIKSNETYYKKELDNHKNLALMRRDYIDFTRKTTNEASWHKYKDLQNKHELHKLATSLKHAEFLKEYEKFRSEVARTL